VEAAIDEGPDDPEDVLADRIRSCYREWKTRRVDEVAANAVLGAFGTGAFEALPRGTRVRWVVDPGGQPCPDADDNALAGALPKGEVFPTGHRHAPAHPGCRCLVVADPG